jgi:DNA-binding transcriptional LysR family regulator
MDIADIELRHLRYFVAVAEELHFGRAAQRLHMAQPPLSQQIRKLEEAIGHPLLLRSSRQVRLTAAGEELLKRAQQTLRKVAEDMHSTRRIGRGEVGTLTVGFIASAMLTVLPRMLSDYRKQFPASRAMQARKRRCTQRRFCPNLILPSSPRSILWRKNRRFV